MSHNGQVATSVARSGQGLASNLRGLNAPQATFLLRAIMQGDRVALEAPEAERPTLWFIHAAASIVRQNVSRFVTHSARSAARSFNRITLRTAYSLASYLVDGITADNSPDDFDVLNLLLVDGMEIVR